VLFRLTCQVDLSSIPGLGIDLAIPDLAAADALALLTALLQEQRDILPQAGVSITSTTRGMGCPE
jgi:hypothetical protein